MLHGGEIYGQNKDIRLDFFFFFNPVPCHDRVLDAMRESLLHAERYPDYYQDSFRKKVAEAEKALTGCGEVSFENVIGTNGASEAISSVINYLKPKKVLMTAPCFSGYSHALNTIEGCKIYKALLKAENDFLLPRDFAQNITADTDLVILTDPNNPTGRIIDPALLDEVADRCDALGVKLLIDECFIDMSTGSRSLVPDAAKRDGIFIIKAYTKLFSIPGVRIGYCISSPENIENIKRFLPEWNVSGQGLIAGEACAEVILSTDYVRRTKEAVKSEREFMTGALSDAGMQVFSSDTGFILFKGPAGLKDRLLEKKVLIRDCSLFDGLGEGFYRIGLKSHEKNLEFVRILGSLSL